VEAERARSRVSESKDTQQLQEQLKELRAQLEKQSSQEQQQRKVSCLLEQCVFALIERLFHP